MEIRPVVETDRSEWCRMRCALYSNPDPKEVDDWFEAAERGGTTCVGVAVLVVDRGDGQLAGFAEIGSRDYAEGCETTPVAYLEGWYVDSDLRRSGLGARLLQAVEQWAKAAGFKELASDTEIDNDVSLRAHVALGFEEVERLICFRKPLRQP
ncbi:MAG: GNAT family N-acetyltransferase [Woeseiaceae bacterium]|nr:GNAT family N-acetyltransferase [Woeseiaceae bacterium]